MTFADKRFEDCRTDTILIVLFRAFFILDLFTIDDDLADNLLS